MKRSRIKSLVVVDDKRIRKVAFKEAERLIKKLERLENDVRRFEDEDQKLYSNWFDLSFRKEQALIKSLDEKYRHLASLHNWMIAVARMDKISLEQAIEKVYKEEELYLRGSNEDKARIEKLRFDRDAFIQRAIENEYASERSGRADSDDPFDGEGDNDLDTPRSQADDAELQAVKNMTDKKIRKICLEKDGTYALLAMILTLSENLEDYALLIRVWDIVPQKHQISFARKFTEETGTPLKKIIEQIRADLKESKAGTQKSLDHEEDRASYGGHFDDHFIGDRSGRKHRTSGEELERCKLFYRKLVRRLHPDLQVDEKSQLPWQKHIWHRVQHAYRAQDTQGLEKLYRLVMIRMRELNEITMGEILESQRWLEDEIEDLNQGAAGMKKLPAWGFARRKTFEPVRKKVERSFRLEQEQMKDRIWDLESQHRYLLAMAKIQAAEDLKKQKRSKKIGHKKAPANKTTNPSQKSFFD